MRGTKEVRIGDFDYEIYQFLPEDGLLLGLELTKLVGPIVAPLFAGAKKVGGGDANLEIGGEAIQALVDAITKHLNPREAVDLIKRLVVVAHAKGVGALEGRKFNEHFADAGNAQIARVLKEVVEHNFVEFFTGLGDLLPKGRRA